MERKWSWRNHLRELPDKASMVLLVTFERNFEKCRYQNSSYPNKNQQNFKDHAKLTTTKCPGLCQPKLGVIWEQETLTKKVHPPQWSMGKPMMYFFFLSSFMHSDTLFMEVRLLRQGFSSNSDIHLPLLPECLNKRHTSPHLAITSVWLMVWKGPAHHGRCHPWEWWSSVQ